MTPDLCPHCGQAIPRGDGYLTPRELDVLVSWWTEGSIKAAAAREGIAEQTAKNLLTNARIRNQAHSTPKLLALHLQDVLAKVRERSTTKRGFGDAA